jgi:hypothetical protein
MKESVIKAFVEISTEIAELENSGLRRDAQAIVEILRGALNAIESPEGDVSVLGPRDTQGRSRDHEFYCPHCGLMIHVGK